MHIYIYIYIYINDISLSLSIYIYIYIYMMWFMPARTVLELPTFDTVRERGSAPERGGHSAMIIIFHQMHLCSGSLVF